MKTEIVRSSPVAKQLKTLEKYFFESHTRLLSFLNAHAGLDSLQLLCSSPCSLLSAHARSCFFTTRKCANGKQALRQIVIFSKILKVLTTTINANYDDNKLPLEMMKCGHGVIELVVKRWRNDVLSTDHSLTKSKRVRLQTFLMFLKVEQY